jgi:hypothetical protein
LRCPDCYGPPGVFLPRRSAFHDEVRAETLHTHGVCKAAVQIFQRSFQGDEYGVPIRKTHDVAWLGILGIHWPLAVTGHIGQIQATPQDSRKPGRNPRWLYEEGGNEIVPDLYVLKFFPGGGFEGQYEVPLPFFPVPDEQLPVLKDGLQEAELRKGALCEKKAALIYEHPAAVVFEPSGFEFPFARAESTKRLDGVNMDG